MNQLKEDFDKMFVTGEFFVYYCFVLFCLKIVKMRKVRENVLAWSDPELSEL